MPKVVVHTDQAPKSLAGYSQAIKSMGLVFVAGQGPFDAKTGIIVGTTIQEHTGAARREVADPPAGHASVNRTRGRSVIYASDDAGRVSRTLRLLAKSIEPVWQEHRKAGDPESSAEAAGLLRTAIATRSDLLVQPVYSTDVEEVCPRCESTASFPLADARHVLAHLGYC